MTNHKTIINSIRKLDKMAVITAEFLDISFDWQVSKSLEIGYDIATNEWTDDECQQVCADFIYEQLIEKPKPGRMCGSGINEAVLETLKQEYPKFFTDTNSCVFKNNYDSTFETVTNCPINNK